jgi:hypothetical protein
MSSNYFSNNWTNNFNTTPPSVGPTSTADSDKKDLDNLINMLNNPALLKEGAQGALYALLSLASMTVQKKELNVRSEMAKQGADLTKAQGQVAQGQAEAMQMSSYASAAGSIGAGAMTLAGSAYTTGKMANEEKGITTLDKKIADKENELSRPADAQVHENATPAPTQKTKASILAEKTALEKERGLKMATYSEKMHLSSTLSKTASEVVSSSSQINSANANASRTLLESSGQQLNQASSELQKNQQTAGEVADSITRNLTAMGDLAKAAVGR